MQNSASKDRQTIFRIKVDTTLAHRAEIQIGSAKYGEREGFGTATELRALCEIRKV